MRHTRILVAVFLATAALILPVGAASALSASAVPNGGFVDSIVWSQQPSRTQALADLRAGNLDLYTGMFNSQADIAEIHSSRDLKAVDAFGSEFDLWLNPVPVSDPSQFNPFALQDVRRALNFLIDRDHVNREFFDGSGVTHTAIFHSRSSEVARNPFFYEDIERAHQFDPSRAKEMISGAMTAAGASFDGTWRWQGNPIVVKFIQRVEDVRFQIAAYVAAQLESAGFTVDLVPMTAGPAFNLVYFGPPDTGEWMVYTEAFAAISAAPWRDDWLAFFHTTLSGESIWFSYSESPELLDVALRLLDGQYTTAEERTALIETGVPLAIAESVRVWLVATGSYAASSAVTGVVHDSGGGLLSPFASRTARFESPGGTLRIGQPSLLFTPFQPWRGLRTGPDAVVRNTFSDSGLVRHPHTGAFTPMRAEFNVETAGPFGLLSVPTDAIVFDTSANAWASVPPESAATSKVSFDYTFGNWHHGVPVTMNDVLEQVALLSRRHHGDIAARDSGALDFSEFQLASAFRGLRVVDADTIEIYLDFWHLDPAEIAGVADLWPQVPWEVAELAMATVLHDHTRLSSQAAFGQGRTWIDLSRGRTLAFMDNEISTANVTTAGPGVTRPPGFEGRISQAEAESRWAAITSWRTTQGHYYPGSGPYVLQSVDFNTRQVVTNRFADYPFGADRWDSFLDPSVPDLEVEADDDVEPGDEGEVEIETSSDDEPFNDLALRFRIVREADQAVLLTGQPTASDEGEWTIEMSPSFTSTLAPGRYRVDVAASSRVAPYTVVASTTFVVESEDDDGDD